jgi:hypothetical protein
MEIIQASGAVAGQRWRRGGAGQLKDLIMPLKLSAYTACQHERPLSEAMEVLKANFLPGRPGTAGASRSGGRSARDMVTARIAIIG